jgi:hypothetical protein
VNNEIQELPASQQIRGYLFKQIKEINNNPLMSKIDKCNLTIQLSEQIFKSAQQEIDCKLNNIVIANIND